MIFNNVKLGCSSSESLSRAFRKGRKSYSLFMLLDVNIVNFVAGCLECQQVKDELRHPVGLLQPYAIPKSKWKVISMNFIVGLPLMARRHDSMFIVVDTRTKSAHFFGAYDVSGT
jgi:hypothetical protein